MPPNVKRGNCDLPPLPKREAPCGQNPPAPPRVAGCYQSPRKGLLPQNIMEMLGLGGNMDSDRILLLGIPLLLSGEECDRLLMMALLYILI